MESDLDELRGVATSFAIIVLLFLLASILCTIEQAGY